MTRCGVCFRFAAPVGGPTPSWSRSTRRWWARGHRASARSRRLRSHSPASPRSSCWTGWTPSRANGCWSTAPPVGSVACSCSSPRRGARGSSPRRAHSGRHCCATSGWRCSWTATTVTSPGVRAVRSARSWTWSPTWLATGCSPPASRWSERVAGQVRSWSWRATSSSRLTATSPCMACSCAHRSRCWASWPPLSRVDRCVRWSTRCWTSRMRPRPTGGSSPGAARARSSCALPDQPAGRTVDDHRRDWPRTDQLPALA